MILKLKKKEHHLSEILNDLYTNKEKLEQMREISLNLAKPNSTKTICEVLLDKKPEDN